MSAFRQKATHTLKAANLSTPGAATHSPHPYPALLFGMPLFVDASLSRLVTLLDIGVSAQNCKTDSSAPCGCDPSGVVVMVLGAPADRQQLTWMLHPMFEPDQNLAAADGISRGDKKPVCQLQFRLPTPAFFG